MIQIESIVKVFKTGYLTFSLTWFKFRYFDSFARAMIPQFMNMAHPKDFVII